MRLEHVAMYVNDLERAKDFFERYFEATSNDGYYNSNTGFRSYFLTFEDGAITNIQNGAGYITSGHWEDEK